MKKINYVTFSSIPSSLPSSLQIIKTCESLSKYKHDVTLIKPGTGNKKFSLKKYYALKYKVNIKEFNVFDSFPRGLKFYIYCFYCLFVCAFYVFCMFLVRWTCMMLRATQTLPMKELNKKVCMDIHTGER